MLKLCYGCDGMIESVNNERVKNIIKLKNVKYRDEEGLFIVEGPHLVKEAKMAGVLKEAYTIDERYEGELVSINVMKKLCQTQTVSPQIGICYIKKNEKIGNRILFLDGIQDPGNLGTLLRSAKAFGFDSVFLAKGTVDVYNDKVIRSSQGAIFKLNYLYGDKLEFINKYKNEYQIFSTNVINGKTPDEVTFSEKIILILGNEGNGVSKEICNLKLNNLYIPMQNMESLNVGVAGSILMYEISKNK